MVYRKDGGLGAQPPGKVLKPRYSCFVSDCLFLSFQEKLTFSLNIFVGGARRAKSSSWAGIPLRTHPWLIAWGIPLRTHPWLIACLPACLLACLPACLLACLPACLLACLPACLLACLPACLLACLPACLLACLPACRVPQVAFYFGNSIPVCKVTWLLTIEVVFHFPRVLFDWPFLDYFRLNVCHLFKLN